MRVVFAGTPRVAADTLDSLVSTEYQPIHVFTREDAPLGRKKILTPSDVAFRIKQHGFSHSKSNRFAEPEREILEFLAPDIGVVVAYGSLIPRLHLDLPRLGWLNIHFSLLPAWRGAAPVQRSIMAGDTVTGVTIFRLDDGMDTGDIVAQESFDIPETATASELLQSLTERGSSLLIRALSEISSGEATFFPQKGSPSFAAKLTREDGRLDWTRPATEVVNTFRGVTSEPGAFTVHNEQSLKIVDARHSHTTLSVEPGRVCESEGKIFVATPRGSVELVIVQPAGKKEMTARTWWNGHARRTVTFS